MVDALKYVPTLVVLSGAHVGVVTFQIFLTVKVTLEYIFFQLAILYYILLDVDECQVNNGGCEETCINNQGSFECSCGLGRILAADGSTCLGKVLLKLFKHWLLCMIINYLKMLMSV